VAHNVPYVKEIEGNVELGRYTGVGTNSVIMPDNHIPEGVVIGALSFVPSQFKFEPWSVYAGRPIRLIKRRNKENILKTLQKLHEGEN
jgi:acetyltransferase-like isoleucine patch superfamily enzyme